jgi:predicted ATPase
MLGDPKTGLAMLEQGLGGWDMIGSIIVRPMFMGLYAEALGLDGQIDKALSLVGDALVIAQEHGEIASEIDLYRIRGELLASQGKKDEAEKAIRYGLELAVRHESPSRQLQAATSLVKLLKGTPQEADARTILTDSLAWFSEGFETTFIKDARTLSDNS